MNKINKNQNNTIFNKIYKKYNKLKYKRLYILNEYRKEHYKIILTNMVGKITKLNK